VLRHRGRRRALLPVPFVTWELIARVAGALSDPPLTRDQVTLMRENNRVAPGAPGFAALGLSPRDLEQALPEELLAEAGYGRDEIACLAAEGVLVAQAGNAAGPASPPA
jgi:NADH dehydrogenase